MALPAVVRGVLLRDVCPGEVTGRGREGGVAWEATRSDCGAGRIVWQMRIVPEKGVSTLAYEAESGPSPIGWRQSGFEGEVMLSEPLDDGEDKISLSLDLKGRPSAPVHVAAGRRLD